MPFCGHLGVRDVSASTARVTTYADWRQESAPGGTALPGGYFMALADGTGTAAAAYDLPIGVGASTIESKTNFLRSASEGQLTIVAAPIHTGRRTIVVQTDIYRVDGQLASHTTQTQAVLSPIAEAGRQVSVELVKRPHDRLG